MFFSLNIKPEQVSLKNAIFTPLVTFEMLSRRQAMPGRRVCKGNSTLYSHWRNAHGSISYLPPCQELSTRPLPFSPLWQVTGIPFAKKRKKFHPSPLPLCRTVPIPAAPRKLFLGIQVVPGNKTNVERPVLVYSWRNCDHFLCKTMDYLFKIGFQVTNCPTGYDQVHFIVILHWLINSWSPRTAWGTAAVLGTSPEQLYQRFLQPCQPEQRDIAHI